MKTVVVYYSYGGNTRRIAEKIGKSIGADLAEIKTVRPYTGSYNDVVEQGRREVESGFLPEIQPMDVDLDRYDTIILGTPVWWYTFAPAINRFLHSVDLSGKTVYPFASNGGWIGHTFKDIEKICRRAEVRAGLNVRFNGDRQLTSEADIQKWTQQIKGLQ